MHLWVFSGQGSCSHKLLSSSACPVFVFRHFTCLLWMPSPHVAVHCREQSSLSPRLPCSEGPGRPGAMSQQGAYLPPRPHSPLGAGLGVAQSCTVWPEGWVTPPLSRTSHQALLLTSSTQLRALEGRKEAFGSEAARMARHLGAPFLLSPLWSPRPCANLQQWSKRSQKHPQEQASHALLASTSVEDILVLQEPLLLQHLSLLLGRAGLQGLYGEKAGECSGLSFRGNHRPAGQS